VELSHGARAVRLDARVELDGAFAIARRIAADGALVQESERA
jgi:hypothetical protein